MIDLDCKDVLVPDKITVVDGKSITNVVATAHLDFGRRMQRTAGMRDFKSRSTSWRFCSLPSVSKYKASKKAVINIDNPCHPTHVLEVFNYKFGKFARKKNETMQIVSDF